MESNIKKESIHTIDINNKLTNGHVKNELNLYGNMKITHQENTFTNTAPNNMDSISNNATNISQSIELSSQDIVINKTSKKRSSKLIENDHDDSDYSNDFEFPTKKKKLKDINKKNKLSKNKTQPTNSSPESINLKCEPEIPPSTKDKKLDVKKEKKNKIKKHKIDKIDDISKVDDDDDEDFKMPKKNKTAKVKNEYIPNEKESKTENKTKKESTTKSKNENRTKKESTKKSKHENKTKKESTKKSKNENKTKRKTSEEKNEEIWKWWEEEPLPEGVKWLKLEHSGPMFPPDYEPLPNHVKFYYNGRSIKLSINAEEVASFYAKMLNHDYTKKNIFNRNFFNDWRDVMTTEERSIIQQLDKCDFKEMADYYTQLSEQKKAMPKEEKDKNKQQNQLITEKYGFCVMDDHKQKVGNFRIEPPGLFRGRGDHPKQGKLKKRVKPSDVIINIGKDAQIPKPPYGNWKAVYHDNTVAWLACWIENIVGCYKYVMLNPTAKLKGQKDMEKFNTARNLRNHVDKIRKNYKEDWKAKDMKTRQRSVALYFIDKLALRAGHEKDEGETADTVGCCSLRVEHIKLHPKYEGDDFVVEFDFLGKDSIRYRNHVPIEKQVYKNLKLFMKNKETGDDLFDRLNTSSLNKYLNELMNNLTAKVFRTYNASNTLQQQLDLLTQSDSSINEKVLAYNRANRAVAILCNHQRTVPKTFEKTMENLNNKLLAKKEEIASLKKEIRKLKKENNEKEIEKKKKKLKTVKEQRLRMELTITDRDENKEIALGTSKLNYLDPRISVSWCKKFDVPIEKIYNKTQREKFHWAIDMADNNFRF